MRLYLRKSFLHTHFLFSCSDGTLIVVSYFKELRDTDWSFSSYEITLNPVCLYKTAFRLTFIGIWLVEKTFYNMD
jgi:hypothetical protein